MKKITAAFLILAITVIAYSCSSPANAGTAVRSTGATGRALSGTWTLTDVTLNNLKGFKVNEVFDEAPYACFKGSKWVLTGSGNGTYTLGAGNNCNGITRKIYWYAKDANTFVFKRLLEDEKAKNVKAGYVLSIVSLTDNSLVLSSPVEQGSIEYTFSK